MFKAKHAFLLESDRDHEKCLDSRNLGKFSFFQENYNLSGKNAETTNLINSNVVLDKENHTNNQLHCSCD